MAESTLSLGYADFQRELGRLCGYGGTPANWTADQVIEVDNIIQSGLRQFYIPPAINGRSHAWTFLEPISNLTTVTDYSTGTISSVSTTVTLTTGTWPLWTATNGTLVVSNTEYAIASRTSDSIIVLSSAPTVAFSSSTFTLKHNGNYTLPDNFGVINGPIFFPKTAYYKPIKITSEKNILQMRADSDITSNPQYAAIKYLNATTQTTGQRLEIMLHPRPNAVWILSYKYKVLLDKISTSLPYAYGGMMHSETLLESILSIMEQRMDNRPGHHTAKFMERLQTSIENDGMTTPDFFGYNGDGSDYGEEVYFRDTIYGGANTVTVSLT